MASKRAAKSSFRRRTKEWPKIRIFGTHTNIINTRIRKEKVIILFNCRNELKPKAEWVQCSSAWRISAWGTLLSGSFALHSRDDKIIGNLTYMSYLPYYVFRIIISLKGRTECNKIFIGMPIVPFWTGVLESARQNAPTEDVSVLYEAIVWAHTKLVSAIINYWWISYFITAIIYPGK